MGKTKAQFQAIAGRDHGVPREEGMAFLTAAEKGDIAAVQAYITKYGKKGLDVRDRDWSPKNEPKWKTKDETALRFASWEGHYDIVKLLLESGADVNLADKRGYTPLMVSHDPKMAGLLLQHGAKLEIANEAGNTVLMWPTTDVMIRFLLEKGANIEHRNKEGMTPIINLAEGHLARGKTKPADNMAAFLDGGAKIDAQDNEGRTALIMAASRAKYDMVEEKHYREMIPVLLARGADTLIRDKAGKSAAEYAREDGQDDVADLLEEYTALRQANDHKMMTQGPDAPIAVMKPLQLKPFALPSRPKP